MSMHAPARLALAALVVAALPTVAGSATLYSMSDVTVDPGVVRAGDPARVSFSFDWGRQPCQVLGQRVSPCYAVMQWRASLDGPYGAEGSVRLAEGQRVYEVTPTFLERTTVSQTVVMPPAAPGEHDVHVLLNVRVLTAYETTASMDDDLFRWFPAPLLGCGTHGCHVGTTTIGEGWSERVASVRYAAGPGNPLGLIAATAAE